MEVILKEDIETLGTTGQIVKVSDGYARNFLVPRGLAMAATPANRKLVDDMREAYLKKQAKLKDEAQELAKLLAKVSITIKAKAGENDHLFGSVTAMDIERELSKQNFTIDRRSIQLDEPIKSLGTQKVNVKLHREVSQEIEVNVVAE